MTFDLSPQGIRGLAASTDLASVGGVLSMDGDCYQNADGTITCPNVGPPPPTPNCLNGTGPLQPGQSRCPVATQAGNVCYAADGTVLPCPDQTSVDVTAKAPNNNALWIALALIGSFLLLERSARG